MAMENPKDDRPRENQQTEGLVENQRAGSPMVSQRGTTPLATRKFILYGILIALLIGVVAVFFASGDPDGLESTALVIQGQKTLTGGTPEGAGVNEEPPGGTSSYSAPMPDYSLGDELGTLGGIVAILAGTLLTVAVVLGAVWAMRTLSRPKEDRIKQ